MRLVPSLLLFAFLALPLHAQEGFEKDVIKTSAGALEITFLGHASLMMKFGGRTIYVDPFSEVADFSKLPKADLLLITHEHQDHFDLKAIEALRGETALELGDVSPPLLVSLLAVVLVAHLGAVLARRGRAKRQMG